MADITLTVDVTSLADAKKRMQDFSNASKNLNVNSLVSSVKGLQGKIKELADAQKSGTINSKTYNLGLLEIKRAYEQLGYSSQKATQMVRAYAAELQRQEAARQAAEAARQLAVAQEQAALSAKRAADRIQELRMRFQDGYAANQRYRQSVNDLKEAYRAGLIPSLDVYKQKLRELRAAQSQAVGNIRGNNGMGVAIQQLGYQVGDFVVQIQSGTSAFVAFGQQATQLVGILPLIHRQLGLTAMQAIGLSTGLGIIIPIATAIGRYFWELSGESKKLADRFSDLSDASGKLSDLFNILESTNLEETYGNLTPQVRELAESFVELNTAGELNTLLSTLDKLKTETEAPWWKNLLASANVASDVALQAGPLAGITSFVDSRINPAQVTEFINEEEFKKYGFNIGRDVYIDLVDGMIAEAKSGDKSGVLEAFQELVDKTTSGDVSGISILGQTALNDLREALTKIAENAAKLDGSAKAAEEANKAAEEAAKATAKALKDAADEADRQAKALQKVNELHTELGHKLDEETVKYLEAQGHERQALALRKQIAYERARDEVLAQAATAQQAIDLAASADLAGQAAEQAVQMAYETERAKDAAKGFADNLRDAASAMSSLTSLGSSIERALAVSQAKVTALKNKADGAVASTIAGYRFDIRAKTDEAINKAAAAGLSPSAAIAEGARQMSSVAELEKSLTQGSALSKENKGGGGSKKKEQDDYLASLLKEAEQKKALIGLSEEEARRKEIIFELTEKGLPIEDARIQKVLEAEEALRRATEAEDRRKAMLDRVQSSMEDAFMSMVDGSKSVADAFKGMIREILLDIYRQQVVNPMAKGIMGLLGGIGGGGGTGSFGLPKPFADGGIVTRASMFPMANGKTGVMGEAGPEAIMPLKRGKDGKLGVQMQGSSGAVVVNQTFNFSANGDDSVKKIIAQAAPQIAMMTQQQIMDSRRRGGSMKAAFG